MRLVDIGWAAGFYEGEGWFGPNQNGSGHKVAIAQKNIEPLLRIQKLFGGEINRFNIPTGVCHRWRVHGVECRQFLLTIFSLLSARRKAQILDHKRFFVELDSRQLAYDKMDRKSKEIFDKILENLKVE